MKASTAADIPEHELLSPSLCKAHRGKEQQVQMKGSACKRRRSYSIDVKAQAIQMRLERGMTLKQISGARSEEHTSELQSLMRISYAVFCMKKKKYTSQQ